MLLILNHLKQCLCCLHLITSSSACAAYTQSSQAVLVILLLHVLLVLLDSCLTLPLFSEIWSLKSSLFMSNQCIRKLVSFTVYHYKLLSSLALFIKIIWLCKKCVSRSLTCCMRSESFKCSKYAAHSFYKCDLVIFKTEWARV